MTATEIQEPEIEAITPEAVPAPAVSKQKQAEYALFNRHFPYVALLVVLAFLYIRNAHFNETLIRQIDETKLQLKVLRWEYMTVKSELMLKSKQTEVAKAVAPKGLKELTDPPKKI